MRILLTGANGFLGSHIIKKLVIGNEVLITLRRTSNLDRIEELIKKYKIKILYIDNAKSSEIESFFKSEGIELVLHCATDYGKKDDYFHNVFESNVLFPLKLLEIGMKFGLKYFVNTDSYFNKKHLTYNALPNYSKTKKLFLTYLREIGSSLSIINMRLEHIYGPNDNDDKFIPYLFKSLTQSKELSLTYGHQKRDFVYVDDVVDSYIKIISTIGSLEQPCYKDLEIGSGKSVSLKYFIETMRSIANSTSSLNYGAVDYRDDEIMNSVANDSLCKYGIDYGVGFNFSTVKEGIERMLRFYNNIESVKKD